MGIVLLLMPLCMLLCSRRLTNEVHHVWFIKGCSCFVRSYLIGQILRQQLSRDRLATHQEGYLNGVCKRALCLSKQYNLNGTCLVAPVIGYADDSCDRSAVSEYFDAFFDVVSSVIWQENESYEPIEQANRETVIFSSVQWYNLNCLHCQSHESVCSIEESNIGRASCRWE